MEILQHFRKTDTYRRVAEWQAFKNNFSLIVFLFGITSGHLSLHAQTSEIVVGSYVKIASCEKGTKSFKHIDLYFKSLVPPDSEVAVDSITGDGVYEGFFVKGAEIDGKRLPCSYGNKKYKVAALHEFPIKGVSTRVMLLYTSTPNELLWVVFDKAVEEKEISW